MNETALEQLGQSAGAWARAYVAIVEALMGQGVPEDIARQEASNAATSVALSPAEEGIGECPVCGK